jgi:hypothetical protein
MNIIVRIFISLFLVFQSAASQVIPGFNVTLSGTQPAGYYMIHTLKPGSPNPHVFNSMIFDSFGNLVYIKKFSDNAGDFKMQQNGQITYPFSFSGNINRKYFIMDSTFIVRDSVKCEGGYFTDSHDMIILPNGHFLMLGFENVTMDLSGYNWFNGNGSPGSTTATVVCGTVQILDQSRNIVFNWRSVEHYDFSDVQQQWLFNPAVIDWTHYNSVEMDSDGNIITSSRHFSEVTKINRNTGVIMWRMGGKRNQFTFINDPDSGFYGQHDARRITNGNITIFDNGYLSAQRHPARGIEYLVNEQNLTAELVWSHAYSNSSSRFLGRMQRLENGNNLIGWGGLISENATFSVVTSAGSELMKLSFIDTLFSYRAHNYPALPWSLNRPQVTCFEELNVSYLDAGAGHSSYLWSTGATTRTIAVTAVDTYYVFVPYGQGGYISSERIIIEDLGDVCSYVIGITYSGSEVPQVYSLEQNYPNPFNPSTNIKFHIPTSEHTRLVIYDITGKEAAVLVNEWLNAGSYTIDFNAYQMASGIYFCMMQVGEFTVVKKMVLLK